jgi:hypothetical protein
MSEDGGKYESQRNYNARRYEEGLTRVTVWVPLELRREIIDYAAELREDGDTSGGETGADKK